MSPGFAPPSESNRDPSRTRTPPRPRDDRGGGRPSCQAPRAGDGNRPHVACLEGRYSTIELHPPDYGRGRLATVADRSIEGRAAVIAGSGGSPDRTDPTPLPCVFHGDGSVPRPSDLTLTLTRSRWVEQDSNLRRQCHQIYSLAPLAAWVSTRLMRRRRRGPIRGALAPGVRRPSPPSRPGVVSLPTELA